MNIEPTTTDRIIYTLVILFCTMMVKCNATRIREGEPWEKTPSIALGFMWAAIGVGVLLLALGWL
jgi:hypothetical protein